MQRYPKGRAKRSRTVGNIARAFEESSRERLSLTEIVELTGSSRRAISETLKEMIELGGIIRIVNDDWPPSTYYMFVEGLSDERISELEERYEMLFTNSLPLMNPIKYVEHHALREGLQHVRGRIKNANLGRFRPLSILTISALKKSKYKLLNRAIDDLRNVAEESYGDETPEEWEKCANCIYGKKIQRTVGYVCICTREWRTGNRPEYEPNHVCDYFHMRMPKH